MQQIEVLCLSHVTSAAEVRTADGNEFVRLAMHRDLWSSDGLARFYLINPKVAKSFGYAKLEFDNIELPIDMTFALEDGDWEVDSTAMEREITTYLKELVQSAEVSKEDGGLSIAEPRTKMPVDISLWNSKN